MYLVVGVQYFVEALVSINAILQHLCSHATVNDSDLLSFIWDSNLGLILILAWMFNTSELDELFRILISIKGIKLRQPQWSNTTMVLFVELFDSI